MVSSKPLVDVPFFHSVVSSAGNNSKQRVWKAHDRLSAHPPLVCGSVPGYRVYLTGGSYPLGYPDVAVWEGLFGPPKWNTFEWQRVLSLGSRARP